MNLILKGEDSTQLMEYFTFTQREFNYKYVVMLSDIDQFQHMSFANYLRLMFLASDALFLAFSKANPDFFETMYLKPIHSQMHFKHQTSFGHEILVKAHSSNVNGQTFELFYQFTREGAAGEEASFGKQVFEVIDMKKKKKIAVPEQFRTFLKTIEAEPTERLNEIQKADADWQKSLCKGEKAFIFDKCVVFFKHTNRFGIIHPYNFLEWTSFVREAFFQETVPNFLEVTNRPIKMMTSKIFSTLFSDSGFGDPMEAVLTVGKIKKVSFDMIIRFFNLRKKKIACETVHTIVFVNSQTAEFSPIPEEMSRVIVHYTEEPHLVKT
jgi:acyl-CoA thioesterase FadM